MSGKLTEAAADVYERALGRAADIGLFSSGGSFESYPGAVLLAGRNGLVLGANETAEPLAALLKQAAPQELRDAINAALEGKAGQITPLLVTRGEDAAGADLAFDVAILPWCDGAAALLLGRDITLERSLRAALVESRQRYKDLVDASSDLAWEVDERGRFTFISPKGALGYGATELVGTQAQDLLIEDLDPEHSPFLSKKAIHNAEIWVRCADGEAACLLVTALPLLGAKGEWRGVRGVCRDISVERSRQAQLAGERLRERLLSYVLGMVRDEMDPQRMLHAAANALVPALPASGVAIFRAINEQEFLPAAEAGSLPRGAILTALLDDVARGSEENRLVTDEGTLYIRTTRCREKRNGALFVWRRGEVMTWSDEDIYLLSQVAEQVGLANSQLTYQEVLQDLSSKDPLTGLLNRRGFETCIEQRYNDSSWQSRGSALFFIDLDNFKAVNDSRGHRDGDQVLIELAGILRSEIRAGDYAARLGGDEFGLFLDDITTEDAARKGRSLLKAAQALKPLSASDESQLSISIGIAMADPDRNELMADLIARADRTMYAVKSRGKDGFELCEFIAE